MVLKQIRQFQQIEFKYWITKNDTNDELGVIWLFEVCKSWNDMLIELGEMIPTHQYVYHRVHVMNR